VQGEGVEKEEEEREGFFYTPLKQAGRRSFRLYDDEFNVCKRRAWFR